MQRIQFWIFNVTFHLIHSVVPSYVPDSSAASGWEKQLILDLF